MKRILSICGGGIRGALTCGPLIALERQTGKLVRDNFDMIAGTSTGALIAAGAAAGIPATRLLDIYLKRAKTDIFHQDGLSAVPAVEQVEWVRRGYHYPAGNIERVLREEFGAAADWSINDAPVRLMLTARWRGRTWYFVRDNQKNGRYTGTCSLVQAAVASAAAPTYFSSYYVNPGRDLVGRCYDGGIGGLANPCYQAAVEAFEYDDFDPADTQLVALGTGYYRDPRPDPNPPNNLVDVISLTIDSLLDSADDFMVAATNRQWPGLMKWFNWPLPRTIDMGDVDAIPELAKIGQAAGALMDWSAILK